MGALVTLPNLASLLPQPNGPETVNTPCAAYLDMSTRWTLVDALMGGTETMRQKREDYLPRNNAETFQAYNKRLNRTFLYEGFNGALDTLVGKPFSEDIVVGETLDKDLVSMLTDDADLLGNDITSFGRQCCYTGLAKGIVHFLVSYTNSTPGTVTLNQKAASRMRPFFMHIDPEQVIGWRYDVENGAPVLSMVRIRETYQSPTTWGSKPMSQVRVLERVSDGITSVVGFTVYRNPTNENKEDAWVSVETGVLSLNSIPLVSVFFGKRIDFMYTRPPLMGLAWKNVEHWQSSSEQRNILNVARIPVWFMKGFEDPIDDAAGRPQSITIGPDTAVRTPNENADMKIVEHTGKAIGAGRQDLLDIEAHMAHMSAEMLYQPSKSQSSATESGNDSKAENSRLAACAKQLEDGLTQGVRIMCAYESKPFPSGKVITINTDFGITPQDAADLQSLYNARISGQISHATYLKELKRRGVLAGNIDVTAEMKQANTDGPVVLPSAPATTGREKSADAPQLTTKAGAGA